MKALKTYIKIAQLSEPKRDFWNDTVLQNIDYSRYLLGHKYNVGVAGVKLGLSPSKILIHDWSKFKPKKFDVYEDFFFGPDGVKSKRIDPKIYTAFRQEVQDHYETESHHNDKIGKPENTQTELESVADWYSVGKTNADMSGKAFPNFVDWWNQNKNKFLLHGGISQSVYNKIEQTLLKDYNVFSYTIDQIKNLF